MRLSAIIGIGTIALVWCCPVAARAQQNPSAVSAKTLTREKFEALPPGALIELSNGERITKQDFIARTKKALQEATNKLQERQSRAEAEFEQRLKKFYDDQNAALAEANKKVEAEVNRLVAADNAAHGPDWATRKKQAAELLDQAKKTLLPPDKQSQLEKQAADLLAPAVK
jgi:hypothetical protein